MNETGDANTTGTGKHDCREKKTLQGDMNKTEIGKQEREGKTREGEENNTVKGKRDRERRTRQGDVNETETGK